MNFEEIEKNYPRHPAEDDSEGGKLFQKYEEEQLKTIQELAEQSRKENNNKSSLN